MCDDEQCEMHEKIRADETLELLQDMRALVACPTRATPSRLTKLSEI